MDASFAVIPDGSEKPSAVFSDLEDALDWALRRYGPDTFRVRRIDLVEIDATDGPERVCA